MKPWHGWTSIARCLSALLVFAWTIFAIPANAQEPLNLWTVDSVRSAVLGEVRPFRVALPVDYNRSFHPNERFPVLIVLDQLGDDLFAAIVANARVLGNLQVRATPPVIVVGVETEVPHRRRDLSPPPRGEADRPGGGYGGAPEFAKFLETELLPYVAARYRTFPYTIIAGHSLSGLFAAYAYSQYPGFVNAAIAISPTLVWSNETSGQIADAVRARGKRGRLFLVTGTSEIDLDSASASLARSLRANPNPLTVVEHRRLEGASHNTSFLQGMIDGLLFVFQPVQLSNSPAGITLAEVDARGDSLERAMVDRYLEARRRYMAGARELGLPERLPATFGAPLAGFWASSGHPLAAKPVCEDVVSDHPDSWVGYDCMGIVLRALKDSAGSAAAYRKGLDIAERAGDSRAVERMRRGLQEVQPKPPGIEAPWGRARLPDEQLQ